LLEAREITYRLKNNLRKKIEEVAFILNVKPIKYDMENKQKLYNLIYYKLTKNLCVSFLKEFKDKF